MLIMRYHISSLKMIFNFVNNALSMHFIEMTRHPLVFYHFIAYYRKQIDAVLFNRFYIQLSQNNGGLNKGFLNYFSSLSFY